MTEPTKPCIDCKQELPLAEFFNSETKQLRPRCSACKAAFLATKNK